MIKRAFFIVFFLLIGCVKTSLVMLDDSVQYPPSNSTQLLLSPPERPYIEIAILETIGEANMGIPELLEDMKKKGMEIGADAVIPTEDVSSEHEQGVMYNPWLGGYQTIGGGTMPKIRGIAIKFIE